jgi:hypothetical protein
MITLDQFTLLTNNSDITSQLASEPYLWDCYGKFPHLIESWNNDAGWSMTIIFDLRDKTVYETSVFDYKNNRAYRMINPDFDKAYHAEALARGVHPDMAWDGMEFIDLELDSDFSQKAKAIVNSEAYDTGIMVQFDLDEKELELLTMLAQEQNKTLDQLVNDILRDNIARM